MSSCLPAVITGLACFSFQPAVVDCRAQIPSSSAREVALGHATVALSGMDEAHENPASMAAVEKATASFGFNRLFGLPELTVHSARIIVPVNAVAVSGSFEQFGYDVYSVSQLTTVLGTVVKSVHVGIRLQLASHEFRRYESVVLSRVAAGWLYRASRAISLGASVTGLTGSQMRTGSLALRSGIAAAVSNYLKFLLSIVQIKGERIDVRFGAETVLADVLVLRLGGTGLAGFSAVGAGLAVNRLRVDVALSYHPRLGFSPTLTVSVTK